MAQSQERESWNDMTEAQINPEAEHPAQYSSQAMTNIGRGRGYRPAPIDGKYHTLPLVEEIFSRPISHIIFFTKTVLDGIAMHGAPIFKNAPTEFKDAIAAASMALAERDEANTRINEARRYGTQRSQPPPSPVRGRGRGGRGRGGCGRGGRGRGRGFIATNDDEMDTITPMDPEPPQAVTETDSGAPNSSVPESE